MSQNPTPEADPDQVIHQQRIRRAALRGLLVYGLFMLVAAVCLFSGFALALRRLTWLVILMPGLAAAMVQPPGSALARRITAALLATAGSFVGGYIILLGMIAQQAREDLVWLSVTAGIGFAFIGFTSGIVHGPRAAFASALAFGLSAFSGSLVFGISRSWYLVLMPTFVSVCGGPVLGIMAVSASLPPGFATRLQTLKLLVVSLFLLMLGWAITFGWINWMGQEDVKTRMSQVQKFEAARLQFEHLEKATEAARRHNTETSPSTPPTPLPTPSNPELDPLR